MLWIIYMNCEIVEINFWRCVLVVVVGLLWVSNCWLRNYNKKNAISNGITDGIAFPLAIPSGFATKNISHSRTCCKTYIMVATY